MRKTLFLETEQEVESNATLFSEREPWRGFWSPGNTPRNWRDSWTADCYFEKPERARGAKRSEREREREFAEEASLQILLCKKRKKSHSDRDPEPRSLRETWGGFCFDLPDSARRTFLGDSGCTPRLCPTGVRWTLAITSTPTVQKKTRYGFHRSRSCEEPLSRAPFFMRARCGTERCGRLGDASFNDGI